MRRQGGIDRREGRRHGLSKGSLILTLETAGAGETDMSAKAKQDTPTAPTPAPAAAPASSPEAKGVLTPVGEAGFATAHASPSVRPFARALGVDPATVPGTGRQGRLLRADVPAPLPAAP